MRAYTYFRCSSLRALVAVVGALLALMVWIASERAPSFSFELRPADVTSDQGSAYLAAIDSRETWLYKVESDGPDGGDASRLRMFEGRWELGPSHTPHAEIRSKGNGRLSHWNGQLWFSASDSSDPRTNGRKYRVEVRQSVRTQWLFLGAVAGAISALITLSWTIAALLVMLRSHTAPSWLARSIAGSLAPRLFGVPATFAIVAAGAVLGGCAIVLGWYVGESSSLGVVRYLPISDAFGYHNCGTNIAAEGALGESIGVDWCARRVIYPAMIAGLLAITDWSSQLALIVQGVLVGASIGAFALVIASTWGPIAAVSAVGVLFVYAWEFVIGLFMTEFSGFILGLAGLSLLIMYCRSHGLWHLIAGTVLVSVGLVSRPGAIFVLPALVVWGAIELRSVGLGHRLRVAALIAIVASAGFVFQVALVTAYGADPSNTGGNFSTSLYGLSTGSRDWTQAYHDFAEEFAAGEKAAFRKVYAAALQNILEHPGTILMALLTATGMYFRSMFLFGTQDSVSLLPMVLFVIGTLRCVIEWRLALAKLALAFGSAELLAAPFIIDSGGLRVFAATVGTRALFVAIGVHWCLRLTALRFRIPPSNRASRSTREWTSSLVAGLGVIVVSLALIPLTSIGRAAQLEGAVGGRCPGDLTEVVARIGHESQYMVIADKSSKVHSIQPFIIGLGRMQEDTRLRATWWGADFLALVPPVSIVRAVDLSSKNHAAVKPLFYRGVLSEETRPVSMCVDDKAFIELAGVRHFEIKRIISAP